MKSNFRSFQLPFALMGALLISVVAVAHDPKDQPMKPMATHSAGSMEMHRIMMPDKPMSMPMSGDVDKDFATMMTMHHQQAIDMVDVLLKDGKNAELKAMATKMKAAQQEEIKMMAPYGK